MIDHTPDNKYSEAYNAAVYTLKEVLEEESTKDTKAKHPILSWSEDISLLHMMKMTRSREISKKGKERLSGQISILEKWTTDTKRAIDVTERSMATWRYFEEHQTKADGNRAAQSTEKERAFLSRIYEEMQVEAQPTFHHRSGISMEESHCANNANEWNIDKNNKKVPQEPSTGKQMPIVLKTLDIEEINTIEQQPTTSIDEEKAQSTIVKQDQREDSDKDWFKIPLIKRSSDELQDDGIRMSERRKSTVAITIPVPRPIKNCGKKGCKQRAETKVVQKGVKWKRYSLCKECFKKEME
jgi:hypothetical protein